jgi:hypothetical protein
MKNFVLAVLIASAVTPAVAGDTGNDGSLMFCRQPDHKRQPSDNICHQAGGRWTGSASLKSRPSVVGVF